MTQQCAAKKCSFPIRALKPKKNEAIRAHAIVGNPLIKQIAQPTQRSLNEHTLAFHPAPLQVNLISCAILTDGTENFFETCIRLSVIGVDPLVSVSSPEQRSPVHLNAIIGAPAQIHCFLKLLHSLSKSVKREKDGPE